MIPASLCWSVLPRRTTTVFSAILTVFSIGFVVPVIIGHKIMQGKAIVSSDKIDTRSGIAVIVLIEVRAAGEAFGKFRQHAVHATPQSRMQSRHFLFHSAQPGGNQTDLVAAQHPSGP